MRATSPRTKIEDLFEMKIFNKRAKFKYQFLEKVEAGVVLSGAEIKSIRAVRVDLSEAFARIHSGEVFLVNAFIAALGSNLVAPAALSAPGAIDTLFFMASYKRED